MILFYFFPFATTTRMIGAPNDGIILSEDTPPNCAANVACAIDSNSTQCTDVLGGSSFTTVVRTSYIGEPDENGCEVYRLTPEDDRVYLCGCNPSISFPGCRFKFFTAAQFDKLVVPGGGIKASEAVVGANAIEQSNSGYGLNGQFSLVLALVAYNYKVFN